MSNLPKVSTASATAAWHSAIFLRRKYGLVRAFQFAMLAGEGALTPPVQAHDPHFVPPSLPCNIGPECTQDFALFVVFIADLLFLDAGYDRLAMGKGLADECDANWRGCSRD